KEIDITDIKGIQVGHAQDAEGATGCTVILCEEGATASVDVRGGGPASRETELLRPEKMVQQVHAVMLSGGSAYGLAAADGAMRYLEERGKGFDVGVGVVPIVCGASCFDLVVGSPKARPDDAMGYAACLDAAARARASQGDGAPGIPMGNVGAGTGATVGKYRGVGHMMKSGLGIYGLEIDGAQCAALVVVNALGDVKDYDTGRTIAGLLTEDGLRLGGTAEAMYEDIRLGRDVFGGREGTGPATNTTLGCIVTNAKLDKSQCSKLAQVAHDGYAKTISPVHTGVDGDAIFVLATGEVEVAPDALGALATEVVGRAVNEAVTGAAPAYRLPAASQFDGQGRRKAPGP
ncbi:MAG: P1 family peptidase, partial [Synergistaceae bacterium]|nr:P1 family peptidase [Synergistaceae bacterium]